MAVSADQDPLFSISYNVANGTEVLSLARFVLSESGGISASDSYELTVYNESDGLIAALGVSDLVIVRSGNITLVAHKTKVDELKSLLKQVGLLKDHEKYF